MSAPGRTVVVTGASGFLGRHVTTALAARGDRVVALTRSERAATTVTGCGATPWPGDLDRAGDVQALLETHPGAPLLNIASLGFGHGPRIVAEAAAARCKRAVFLSTTAIFTTLDAAGRTTRLAAEDAITGSPLAWTILRPTMIYGAPGDRNMERLLRYLLAAPAPVLPLPGGGRRLLQPVHVDDLAAAVIAALDADGSAYHAYDVAGPEALSLTELFREAAQACARRAVLVPVPLGATLWLARRYEHLARSPRLRSEQIERLAEDKAFDITTARADLGHAPRSFADGITAEVAQLDRRRNAARNAAPNAAAATRARRAARTLRTVAHMTASQAGARVMLRGGRRAVAVLPEGVGATAIRTLAPVHRGTGPTWPASYRPVGLRMAELDPGTTQAAEAAAREGRFRFIGEERTLGSPAGRNLGDAPALWRYHLHYFEWAWWFALHPDAAWASQAFAELWRSWRDGNRRRAGTAWHPYVASLRAFALASTFDALLAKSDVADLVREDLAATASYLRVFQERDVAGNHLVKNVKALIALAVFFGDEPLLRRSLNHLERELARQVLADGGHYERATAYHAQVLADVIDIADLLDAAGLSPSAPVLEAAGAMRAWLGAMRNANGCWRVNDGPPVPPELCDMLGAVPCGDPIVHLADSGYVVLRSSAGLHVALDAGLPCPDELPAHAHADCLSLLAELDGRPLLVDTGTSTYEAGVLRDYERSTAAHNTVSVDGADQTEVYGAFRAGRRARPTIHDIRPGPRGAVARASHDGFRHLPGAPVHTRTVTLNGAALEVADGIAGGGTHDVTLHWHFAPGIRLLAEPGTAYAFRARMPGRPAREMHIAVSGPEGLTCTIVEPGTPLAGEIGEDFGRRAPSATLRARYEGPLPAVLVTQVATA